MKRDLQKVGEVSASFGAALLLAGYLRYTIQGDLERFSEILLIAGGILLLAGLAMSFRGIMRFFSKRSSQVGTNTVLLAIGVLAILIVFNYFGFQHKKTFDLTSEKFFTLSDQTKKIVGGLKTDVNVVRFSKTPDSVFNELLNEYRPLSLHLKFETIDPDQKPDVAKDYGISSVGDVVVAAGDRKQTVEGASAGNLTEENLTSAIMKVTQTAKNTACFVTGHGEKSTSDSSEHGYSFVSDALKKEGLELKDINLLTTNGVPSDCSLVIVAGPTKSFFPQEEQALSKYLSGGGKALFEVDPDTDPKLDDIFKDWNISVGEDVVFDPSRMLLGAGPQYVVIQSYGDSSITAPLKQQTTFFPLARTVSIADKSKTDGQRIELLQTTDAGFTRQIEKGAARASAKPGPSGVQTLGIAAFDKAVAPNARLVVIGDSDFASNAFVTGGSNADLFDNTIDWLAQQENQISIRPKQPTDRHIQMTEAQRSALTWLDVFFLPGIVIISGVAIWWKRR